MNIYKLYGEMFLVEFPNRYMAEQTIYGELRWKNTDFISNGGSQEKIWVRVVGIPLHLWLKRFLRK